MVGAGQLKEGGNGRTVPTLNGRRCGLLRAVGNRAPARSSRAKRANAQIRPGAPKVLNDYPHFPRFLSIFPVFPGTSGRAPWIPGVQTEKMGEKWGKMGKKWVKNEVTGVQKTVLMHASAHLECLEGTPQGRCSLGSLRLLLGLSGLSSLLRTPTL